MDSVLGLSNLKFNVKYGIINLIKWLPIIWKDRDWDEYFLYKILHKKLSHMEVAFRTNYDWGQDESLADEIKVVKEALGRLIEDEYYKEACAILNFEPYGYSKEVFELEEELIHEDIEKVFSATVSSQIRKWWD